MVKEAVARVFERAVERCARDGLLPGGELPAGEGDSYALPPDGPRLALAPRPLADAVTTYVDWLRLHPAAQGGPRA